MICFDQRGRRRWGCLYFSGAAGIVDLVGGLACLIVTVTACSGVMADEQAIVRDVVSREKMPLGESGLTCGRDCLYLWLRLQGVSVSYDDVQSQIDIGPSGSEMSEILKASRVWEPSTRLAKLAYSDLCALKRPAIVHVWVTQGKDRKGHYMVVTRASEEGVSMIETATQMRTDMTPQAFSELWSSYALYKGNPVIDWALSLPIVAVLLIVWQIYSHVKKKRFAMKTAAVSLCVLLAAPGCNRSPDATVGNNQQATDGSEPGRKIEVIPIAASKRHTDLGIIPLNKLGTAQFFITNLRNEPVELQLGKPSCGCTQAVLSEETVGPKGTATLEISLGAEGGSYAGLRQGAVELGVKGIAGSLRFSVEGFVEGISLFPYTLRLATKTGGYSPGPLEGEIHLGASGSANPVSIDDLTMEGREGSGLAVGQAIIKPSVEIKGYVRQGFEIPISVRAGLRPEPGVYPIRMTVRIGDEAVMRESKIFVVPAMEE